jgi:hypothetical protein
MGLMEEIWRDISRLVAEIAQYPTHVCYSSRYTNSFHLFFNRVIANSD